jgi:hypothetical protein
MLLNLSNLMVDLTKAAKRTMSRSALAVTGTNVPTTQQHFVPKGKGQGKGTIQSADGKYMKFQGAQVCFTYNRHQGGCEEICPNGRAHICEICTGKHRAIDCKTPMQRPM